MGEAQLRLNSTKIADAQPVIINRIFQHKGGVPTKGRPQP